MKKALLLVIVVCLLSGSAVAATYYVDGMAANDSGNGSSSSPKKYIKSGIALMTGGDTLIIRNGVYTGMNNMMCSDTGWEWTGIPNGTAGAYTTIKAENDFGVIIDGEGVDSHMPLYINTRSYIQFEGLIFRYSGKNNGATNFHLLNCNHVKVLRCAAYEPASTANPTAGGEEVAYNFYAQHSTYCLFEDCFTWGRARYQFINGGTYGNYGDCSNNICRRCVGRLDGTENHSAANAGVFVNYCAGPNYYQNCIAVDGADPGNVQTQTNRFWYGPNGTTGIVIDSCLGLANVKGKVLFESASNGTYLKNSVFWGNLSGAQWYTTPSASDIKVEGCTFGNLGPGTDPNGVGLNIEDRAQSVKNNIFTGLTSVALIKSDSGENYNCLYNNGANYSGTTAGANDITTRDPKANGLRYLLQIESGAYLKTAGESGGQIGAQIVKQLGVSGTLYGETGWNTVTANNLWPFPNENIIRAKMRLYNLHGVNGARGFCADGTTLTKYIWEYLGNPMPADMYDMGVSTPTNLTATALSSRAIALMWAANPLHETGFRIERKNGSNGTYNQITEVGANAVAYNDVGLSPNSTYYYRVRSFNAVNQSPYSNEAFAATLSLSEDISVGKAPLVSTGQIRIIGSSRWKGTINPDAGETAKIYFKGSDTGKFEVKIFNLTGELVWEQSMDNVSEGMFEWSPKHVASGGYIVYLKGPGINARKKIAVLR